VDKEIVIETEKGNEEIELEIDITIIPSETVT